MEHLKCDQCPRRLECLTKNINPHLCNSVMNAVINLIDGFVYSPVPVQTIDVILRVSNAMESVADDSIFETYEAGTELLELADGRFGDEDNWIIHRKYDMTKPEGEQLIYEKKEPPR